MTIDDEDEALIRVYGDFMGVVMDSGSHGVVFRFDPSSFRVGGWLTLGGLGLICSLGSLAVWRTRRGALTLRS